MDEMNRSLNNLAEELGVGSKVLFLGYREDVSELYSIFDVYCLPSLYEGMPITILEAMASGVPIAATDVLGINGLITSGENGILAKSCDNAALAHAIVSILEDNDLAARLADNASKYVNDQHSMDVWIGRCEEVFMTVYGK